MPKYVIERDIPGAGSLNREQVQGIAKKSCDVIKQMGSQIQWIQSYITEDQITCLYIAPDEQTLIKHARKGGFPADRILRVATIIDPATAEG